MEEFEGVKTGDIAELKRIIGQENVTIRKVYDTQAQLYPRRASFIGSTNNMQFLKDYGGNRRFLVIPVKTIDYRTPVDHKGVYAQAVQLIEDGFRYWFEGNEIDDINTRNERHRMKDPLEENLYVYFRPAGEKDFEVKWKPAAAILATLSVYGRTQANAANATSVGTDSGKGCLRQACKHPWHHGVCRSGTHTTGGERKLQEKGEGKGNG